MLNLHRFDSEVLKNAIKSLNKEVARFSDKVIKL